MSRPSAGKTGKPRERILRIVDRPKSERPHDVRFYVDASGREPAKDFVMSTPPKVSRLFWQSLQMISEAPPKNVRGGGYWEAMHGEMTGWFEIRIDGPGKKFQYRFFCIMDYEAIGETNGLLVVVAGISKPVKTLIAKSEYLRIKKMGSEYLSNNPRRTM